MPTSSLARIARLLAVLACYLAAAALGSQDGLNVIDNPGGGRVVYGTVNQATPQAAMAAVLHYVHQQFGERPLVGNAFQSRGGQDYGAFFTVTARSQGDSRIAGLVLVSLAPGAAPAAALLYDDASRFAGTEPALMQALSAAWRKAATAPSADAGGGDSGDVPALTRTPFPDGSGAVDLPAGWRIAFASHSAAKIVGPHGETVLLSNTAGPIYDPANPRVRMQLRYANPNNPPLLCPNADALHTYLCLLQQKVQQPVFQLKRSQPLPPRGMAVQSQLVDADIDLHDGRGLMSCELGVSVTATGPLGNRTLGLNGTCAPQAEVAQERATLKAIFDSYRVNDQVVMQEYAADARRSIAAGNAARAQARQAHAAEDARAAAFQAHMDNIDRFSKSLQNYQLDQTELQDNEANARGAVPNSLADALVKANPERFQTVPTQDFLKGTDF